VDAATRNVLHGQETMLSADLNPAQNVSIARGGRQSLFYSCALAPPSKPQREGCCRVSSIDVVRRDGTRSEVGYIEALRSLPGCGAWLHAANYAYRRSGMSNRASSE